ncbi:MAG TPA: TonB-dependent receptor [Candidatus Didemnitutus sp.]|nr:TonB-dependent receptor [Candidatus Didemnitutus sp.]
MRSGRAAPRGAALALSLLVATAAATARGDVGAADNEISTLKKLSVDELMEIEVTSVTKEPERLLDAASSIEVVTSEDIARSGATSLPEALRLADNLDVAQKNAHDWAITARGFNTDLANKLLVLMDGRTIYTPLFSGVFWDRQDYLLEDIDRIEVISGPGGALWGANAVNGVINITSKSARDTQGWYVESAAGPELREDYGVRYGGQLASNVYFRVYGKYTNRDPQALESGSDASDSEHFGQGGFRLDAFAGSSDQFTLQGDLYNGTIGIATGGDSRLGGGNVLGRWSHTLTDGGTTSLQVYYDRTHLVQDVPGVIFAPAGTFVDDLDTWDIDFQHHFRWGGRNNLAWGTGYRWTHDTVGNAPALAFFPTTLDQGLFSAFVQDEISLRPDLRLTLGTKVEHNDYTGFEAEPSVRLQWNPTARQMLWAAVSRAVRTPSRIDRDLSEPAPGYLIVLLEGNPNFRSEEVLAYELGWRAEVAPGLAMSVSTFYNRYDDVRSTSISAPDPVFHLPFPFYFENNLEGDTYGAEWSANWQVLPAWRLHAGYTLLRENLWVRAGAFDYNNALNELGDPEQRWNLRSSFDLPHGIAVDADLRWVDDRPLNNAGEIVTIPSYTELDVQVAWKVTRHLELALVGRNLLHGQHLEYGISNATSIPEEIQRSIYGKASWRF